VCARHSTKLKQKGEIHMKKSKLFVALLSVMLMGAIFAQPVFAAEPSTITVTGTGAVSVTPDFATVRLGVTTENPQPGIALTENNARVAAVIAAIRALGIDAEDIRTANFTITDVRDANWVHIIGHRVNNTVTVTIHDIDQVGDIIGAAIAAGATVSGGVSFGITDSSEAYNLALALAVQNANSKGRAIAAALGANIDSVVAVVEMGGMHMPVAMARQEMAFAADSAGWGVPIEAGDLTVTANVQITFSIAQ